MKTVTHPFGATTDPQEGAACILAVLLHTVFDILRPENSVQYDSDLHGVARITKGKSIHNQVFFISLPYTPYCNI